jgi:hypothetical protein
VRGRSGLLDIQQAHQSQVREVSNHDALTILSILFILSKLLPLLRMRREEI